MNDIYRLEILIFSLNKHSKIADNQILKLLIFNPQHGVHNILALKFLYTNLYWVDGYRHEMLTTVFSRYYQKYKGPKHNA